MFFGYKPESGNTRIGRVYRSASPPNEVIAVMDWAILQNETSPVHGGLYIDQTGLFNRDLLVVTGGGVEEGAPGVADHLERRSDFQHQDRFR